ncbi:SwmB domain-containing protein [Aureimonas phyllosphaerae]|uniref:SwmB domain-containing protein n=1 Tax=Aureimonas phyllosphaerae TaxID=1166078 RepID=UPI003A5C73FE
MCGPSINLLPASDTGTSNSDGITSDPTPSFSGSYQVFPSGAVPNATVDIYANGLFAGSAVTASDGSFDFTSSSLPDGDYRFEVVDRASGLPANSFFGTGPELVTVDTAPPALASSYVNGDSLVLTFDKSFDASFTPAGGDFTVLVDGIPSTVTAVSASGRELILTLSSPALSGDPVEIAYTDATTGDVTAIRDVAGNELDSIATRSVTNVTGDVVAPTFVSAEVSGNQLVLTYDEALRAGALPAANAFTVDVGGSNVGVTNVSVDGNSVTLTLASSAREGDVVSVTYVDPTGGDDTNAVQDFAGNDAASLTNEAATNDTVQQTYAVADATTVTEGGVLRFVVSRTGDLSVNEEVSYMIGGTAASTDIDTPSGQAFFAAGQSTTTISVNTVQDSASESTETVTVTLTGVDNGGAIGSRSVANGQITDDDVSPPSGGGGNPAPAPTPIDTVGTEGPDAITGTAAADTVMGGQGADTLLGNQGNDSLNGNQGDDTVRGGQGNDIVRGGQDDDEVQGDRGDDQVFGDNGNDVVNGNQGADTVNGGMGDDIVRGGQDNDEVRGGQGDDFVFGDLGNDEVWGDLGNDTLSGGAGADVFQFAANSGNDVVTDFSRAEGDTLNFGGQTYTVADVDGSAVFTLSGGGTVVLTGVSSASLDAGAFA